jgi:hypothetical protein
MPALAHTHTTQTRAEQSMKKCCGKEFFDLILNYYNTPRRKGKENG